MLAVVILGFTSVAHAYDNNYLLWQQGEREPIPLRFGSRNVSTVDHRGDPGYKVYMVDGNATFEGAVSYNTSDIVISFMMPDSTSAMTFFGHSVDRTGKHGWKGTIMWLNNDGRFITRNASLK